MKDPLMLGLFIVCTFTGCGTKHYFEQEGNSVSFYYQDSETKEVLFAASLDGFAFHGARKVGKNLWKITMQADKDFSYFYRVDGVITVPDCTQTENDDFGDKNCVFDQEFF